MTNIFIFGQKDVKEIFLIIRNFFKENLRYIYILSPKIKNFITKKIIIAKKIAIVTKILIATKFVW